MAKDKSKSSKKSKGMSLVEANFAAEGKAVPLPSLVELNKYLKSIGKEDGGPAAPIMPEKAKEIRKKKRRERNASREQTRMPSKKMREAMAKGYRDGGAVCRGMGAAISGGSFKGTF